jgi:hypothetical protein
MGEPHHVFILRPGFTNRLKPKSENWELDARTRCERKNKTGKNMPSAKTAMYRWVWLDAYGREWCFQAWGHDARSNSHADSPLLEPNVETNLLLALRRVGRVFEDIRIDLPLKDIPVPHTRYLPVKQRVIIATRNA